MRTMTLEGKTERITWLLSTAMIEPVGPTLTGALNFEDLEGTGLDILAEWSAQIGNEIGYYPQRLGAQLILNGAATDGTANAYDTVPYFASNSTVTTIGGVSVTGHPYNPFRPTLGGYANRL